MDHPWLARAGPVRTVLWAGGQVLLSGARRRTMLERFTDRARLVVVLAEEEARMLGHNWIGTEHLLLGLLRQGDSVAVQALVPLGISLQPVRQEVEEITGPIRQVPSEVISFTPRSKKVLELALRESLRLGHDYIGPEHILLALIREGDGVAPQVLVKLGADLNRVRQQVIQLISGQQPQPAGAMKVRPREAADLPAAEVFLAEHNSARVARRGELLEPLDHPALLAEAGGGMLGLLTYVPGPGWEQCEVLTLHVTGQWHGVGTALIEAVEQLAAEHGCARLWLITTNDNVDALRFYQRRGFQLAAIHRHAVDESRGKLKPEIPVTGAYGIPVRDEIELEKRS
jgi:GNAT superfamily N-acetyltransferase